MAKEILSLKEAAQLLRVAESDLREAVERGEVPGRAIAGEWRFSRYALHGWLSGGRNEENPWLKWAGAMKDNPLWPEVMESIAAAHERQRQEAIHEAEASETEHPLVKFAGIFKDDPVFEEVMTHIEAESERQRQEAIREAEVLEKAKHAVKRTRRRKQRKAT